MLRVSCEGDEESESRMTESEKLLVSSEEAGVMLSIGRSGVWLLMQSGELESIKIGKRRLIPVAALHDYVTKKREERKQ